MTDPVPLHDHDDPSDLDRFFRVHGERVLRWTIRLGGPRIDAEDVAQDVLMAAFQSIERFRGGSKPETWLFGITRNVVRSARRKAAVRAFVGLGDAEAVDTRAPDGDLDRLRRRRAVQRALMRLSEGWREAIVLVDLEGFSTPEAAALLSVPEGTISSRLFHGRRAFARALAREGIVAETTR